MAHGKARGWTRSARSARVDPVDVALRELEVAIELVVSGRARVVELVGLEAAERVAAQGLAQTQAAGVRFELRRSTSVSGAVRLRIGPCLDV